MTGPAYSDLAWLVTFRPLDGHLPCAYRSSQFRGSWSSTVELLERELRAVGARRAILEVALSERDFRVDGLPRANARAYSPAVRLSFEASRVTGQPSLRYEVGTYDDWQDNVRAIAKGLEALRAVDRYGVTKRGEQYAGWKQLPAGVGGDGDPARGRELIDRAGSVTAALKAAHPDHGGDPDDFRDVIAARDAA